MTSKRLVVIGASAGGLEALRSLVSGLSPGFSASICVVLTGNLDDGTAGLWTIKRLGGTAIVQDPSDALFPSMPEHALEHVEVDHVVPLSQIPSLLADVTVEQPPEPTPVSTPAHIEMDVNIAKTSNS
jgi:two-component system chemotaxis response regulator CheB